MWLSEGRAGKSLRLESSRYFRTAERAASWISRHDNLAGEARIMECCNDRPRNAAPPAPLIDAIISVSNEDKASLCRKIISNVNLYKVSAGQAVSARRIKVESLG